MLEEEGHRQLAEQMQQESAAKVELVVYEAGGRLDYFFFWSASAPLLRKDLGISIAATGMLG